MMYCDIEVLNLFNVDDIKYPIILSIPHSGRDFPEEFLRQTKLSIKELRTSEDPYLDELLEPLINMGLPTIKLNVPRTLVDVNRDKAELDENMFSNFPQSEMSINSRRARFGFGVIPRINDEGKKIYEDKIPYEDAQEIIKNVYDVYHNELKALIEKVYKKFGTCIILDAHSMPSKICNIMIDDKAVDFCVATLFEQSAPQEIWQTFGNELALFDYRVEYNRPYSGAFITLNYCQPKDKIYTMQLEINRSIYINEKTLEKKPAFETLKNHIKQSVCALLEN